MTTRHFLKHLRVLFTLLCAVALLAYGAWLIYYQFIDNQSTQPMLAQAQTAKANYESSLTLATKETARPTQEVYVPVYSDLTAMDLLNVQEVINRALSAVMFDENSELILLQARLLDTAKQLNLAPSQIDYINSPQSLNFMKFRAKRTWFNQEVERRYINVQSLDGLLARFPEARGELYQQATELIIDRDLIIFEIAKNIAASQQRQLTDDDIEKAKLQWQASLSALPDNK